MMDCSYRLALEEGNVDQVQHQLITVGRVKVRDYFDDGMNPLTVAIEGNHCDMVSFLLKNNACPDAKVNPNHQGYLTTPLGIAVCKNNIQNIRQLLANGANINCRDSAHRTPLHIACSVGADDVVRVLLEHGADPNTGDRWGRAALHVVLYNLPTKILNYDRLMKFYRIVESLIRNGTDVNKSDDHGCTPIYLCAVYGDDSAEICWLLITKGAQVNLSIKRNLTPFQLACRKGHVELCKLFIHNNFSYIPKCMNVAIKAGRAAIVNLLVDAGYHPRYRAYCMLFPCGDVSAFPKLCAPMSLQTLCRTVIRKSEVYKNLDAICYPAKLKDYVHMRNTSSK